MKLAILDAQTCNPGDLSWDGFESVAECVIHPITPPEKIAERLRGVDAVLTNKVPIRAADFEANPNLRYVGVLATGFDVIDVAEASARGVTVTNVPSYSTKSVAQLVFAMIGELTLGVGHHAREVAAGRWQSSPTFVFWDRPLIELDGKTLGIAGYGRIGRSVAEIGRAHGMRIVAFNRSRIEADDVEQVSLDELFSQSDVVSIHVPLTPETKGLVDASALERMKPSAYVINTSRGPVVDSQALADALNAGRISGAAVDVLDREPPVDGNPLIGAKNCLVTPHIAWATVEARQRLLQIAESNLRAFLSGKPTNVVS